MKSVAMAGMVLAVLAGVACKEDEKTADARDALGDTATVATADGPGMVTDAVIATDVSVDTQNSHYVAAGIAGKPSPFA